MSKAATPEDLEAMFGPEPSNVLRLKRAKPTEPRRRPFQFYTYDNIKKRPKKEFLIGDRKRPVLLEGALWQIFGRLKSAKTFYTMEVAFCIAFGLPFNGLPTKPGNVIYIIAEGSIDMNFERIEALCEKYRRGLCGLLDLDIQVTLDDIVKAAMATGRFNLTDDAINLAAEDPEKGYGVKVFLGEVEQTGINDVVLVVLDTWARMLWAAGGHDSDQNTVGPSIRGCDYIRRALDCAVIMVAHIGVAKDSQDRAKGLSDPAGAVDGATRCEKKGKGPEATYHFEAAFQRFAQDEFKLIARLRSTGPSVVLAYFDEGVSSKKTAKLGEKEQRVLNILRAIETNDAGEVAVTDWGKAVKEAKLFTGAPATVRQAFKRARDTLVAADRIEIINGMVTVKGDAAASPDQARADLADEDEGPTE